MNSHHGPVKGYDSSHSEENTYLSGSGERCRCGAAITAITTRGPGIHVAQPCGHQVGLTTARAVAAGSGHRDRQRPRLRADGGRTTDDLTSPRKRLNAAIKQARLALEDSDDSRQVEEISNGLDHLETARDGPAPRAIADGSGHEEDEWARLEAVDGVGPATIDALREEFNSLDELLSVCDGYADNAHSPIRLSRIDGWGPSRASKIAGRIDESDLGSEPATDGGVVTAPEETGLQDAVYYRVEGVGADDVGEPFRELANDIFSAIEEHHGDAIEGVVPVFNEEFDPRLGDDTPRCAASGCEQPMDHVVHGVLIDGVQYDVPTCGGHDGELATDGGAVQDDDTQDLLNLGETSERNTVGWLSQWDDLPFSGHDRFRTDVLRRALLEYEREYGVGEVHLTTSTHPENEDARILVLAKSRTYPSAIVAAGCEHRDEGGASE